MATYRGSVCRLCRRENTKLFLKGERCLSAKCAIERRAYPPGMHGLSRRRKVSEFGIQLREKQKTRRYYGLMERQFHNTFKKAAKKVGITGEIFLQMLETRLDNVVHHLGFASSRRQARQLVSHGHFTVNGKRVDLPSFQVKKGDVIEVHPASRKKKIFEKVIEKRAKLSPVSWLAWAEGALKGEVLDVPRSEDIKIPVEEHLIVEFYSK